jgi:nucleoid-associated protein YgaU
MDTFKFNPLKSALLLAALVSMSACSSSQVDDASGDTPETAAVGEADSSLPTDAVPEVADVPPGPDSTSPVAEDPALASNAAPEALPAEPPKETPSEASAEAAPVAAAEPAAPAEPVVKEPAAPVAPAAQEPVAAAEPASAPAMDEPKVVADGKPYRVRKGDTLMKIAFEKYGDLYRWKEIYEANRKVIKDPNHVPPGTKISLSDAGMVTIERNGERYLIKRGDTLGIISNDVYGTRAKWKKLWENNRQLIKDPNKIYAGFSLYYVPEARLTREKQDSSSPASDAGSAQNLPFKSSNPEKTVAQAPAAQAPAANAPAPAAQDAARAPASSK